jgi:CRP-like cAMP-binding protein
LKKLSFFSQEFSTQFLEELSLSMKEITLGPGETLYNTGEYDERIYFLRRGELFSTFKSYDQEKQGYTILQEYT